MRTITQRPVIRKRSFLLVEVLLAMGLLALCLLPLIQSQLGMIRSDLSAIRTMQEEGEVARRFCLLKQALYEQAYSWEALYEGVSTEAYVLHRIDHSSKSGEEVGLQLGATFYIGNHTYERTLYLQKTARLYPY